MSHFKFIRSIGIVFLILLALAAYTSPLQAMTLTPVTCTIGDYGSSVLNLSGNVRIVNDVAEVGFEYRLTGTTTWTSVKADLSKSFSKKLINLSPGKKYDVRAYYRLTLASAKELSTIKTVTLHKIPKIDIYLQTIKINSVVLKVDVVTTYKVDLRATLFKATDTDPVYYNRLLASYSSETHVTLEVLNLISNMGYRMYIDSYAFDWTNNDEASLNFVPLPQPTPTLSPTPAPSPTPTAKPASPTPTSPATSGTTAIPSIEPTATVPAASSTADGTTVTSKTTDGVPTTATQSSSTGQNPAETTAEAKGGGTLADLFGGSAVLILLAVIAVLLIGIAAILIMKMRRK